LFTFLVAQSGFVRYVVKEVLSLQANTTIQNFQVIAKVAKEQEEGIEFSIEEVEDVKPRISHR